MSLHPSWSATHLASARSCGRSTKGVLAQSETWVGRPPRRSENFRRAVSRGKQLSPFGSNCGPNRFLHFLVVIGTCVGNADDDNPAAESDSENVDKSNVKTEVTLIFSGLPGQKFMRISVREKEKIKVTLPLADWLLFRANRLDQKNLDMFTEKKRAFNWLTIIFKRQFFNWFTFLIKNKTLLYNWLIIRHETQKNVLKATDVNQTLICKDLSNWSKLKNKNRMTFSDWLITRHELLKKFIVTYFF